MTVKECYMEFGGDYEDVMARMPDEEFVAEFLQGFLEDESFLILQKAMKSKSVASAFRGAHSLKGICQNFGYTKLYESSSILTELLRTGSLTGTEEPMRQVSEDYQLMIRTIKKWMNTDE